MHNRNLTMVCKHPDVKSEDMKEIIEKFDLKLDTGERVYVNFDFLFGWEVLIRPKGKMTQENYMKSHVCVLIPHMKTAVVTNKRFYDIPKARERLREAGYISIQRTLQLAKRGVQNTVLYREPDEPDKWIYRRRDSIIRAIRSEKHPEIRATDSRLIKIVQEISRHIHPKLLTFGTFKPNVKQDYTGKEVDFHDKSPILQFYQFSPEKVEQGLEEVFK